MENTKGIILILAIAVIVNGIYLALAHWLNLPIVIVLWLFTYAITSQKNSTKKGPYQGKTPTPTGQFVPHSFLTYVVKYCFYLFKQKQECWYNGILNTHQHSWIYKKCQLEESNLRPSLYEGDALPAELSWHKRRDADPTINTSLTPVVRLELTTPWLTVRCSTNWAIPE